MIPEELLPDQRSKDRADHARFAESKSGVNRLNNRSGNLRYLAKTTSCFAASFGVSSQP
jgi:hypothetical protein